MGNNNLSKVEKNLRSIAKRYKTVKYSLGLAILFLMMGVSAFSEETVQEVPTNEQIATSRENLKNSVGNLQSKIDNARAENGKKLKGLKLQNQTGLRGNLEQDTHIMNGQENTKVLVTEMRSMFTKVYTEEEIGKKEMRWILQKILVQVKVQSLLEMKILLVGKQEVIQQVEL